MPTVRRRLLAGSAAWLAMPAWVGASTRPLVEMTDGPFYPPRRWREGRSGDWDADLTRVGGTPAAAVAMGEHFALSLKVQDVGGRAVDGAEVEIWQCDALAAYHHPDVREVPERFDPAFQGFGAARSGHDGQLRFRTIRPVPYPGRTPHIHVKLRHATFGELTSQLFVEGEAGNARDFLWRRLDAPAQAALAMRLEPAAGDGLRWQARHTIVVPS